MGFLTDSCVWIDAERGLWASANVAALTSKEPVYLSRITIAELRFGAEVAQEPGIRQRRLAALHRIRRNPLAVFDAITRDTFVSPAANQRDSNTAPGLKFMACEPGDPAFLPISDPKSA